MKPEDEGRALANSVRGGVPRTTKKISGARGATTGEIKLHPARLLLKALLSKKLEVI